MMPIIFMTFFSNISLPYQLQPTVVDVLQPPEGCSYIGQSDIVVTIDADIFPGETSWEIFNASTSSAVASGGGLNNRGVHIWRLCLPAGDYTFKIYDSYGDGLSDNDGVSQFFSIIVDGVEEFKVDGYDFGDSHSEDFTVLTVSNCSKSIFNFISIIHL